MTQFLGITSSTISAPQQRDGWGLEPAHGTSFFSLECATAFKWVECVQVRQGMGHGNRTSTVRMRPRTWRQGVAAAWWDKFGHVFLDCQLSMDNLQSNKETCQTCSWPWQTLYLCDQAIHHGDAYGLSHAMEKADVYTVVLSIYQYIYILYNLSFFLCIHKHKFPSSKQIVFQALSNLIAFVSLASRGYPAWLRGCGFLPFHAQDNQGEELKEGILNQPC